MTRFFKLKEHGTDVKTEVIGGLTTFLTMAYIIFVNPMILSEAGMRIVSRRAKWFLNRRLINLVGVTLARGVAALDRLMQNTAPDFGWDGFVVAEKVGESETAAR